MKINAIKLKKLDFHQRLKEIDKRLKIVDREYSRRLVTHGDRSEDLEDALEGAMWIVEFWLDHMKETQPKPEKKGSKKPVNLWE